MFVRSLSIISEISCPIPIPDVLIPLSSKMSAIKRGRMPVVPPLVKERLFNQMERVGPALSVGGLSVTPPTLRVLIAPNASSPSSVKP